jgi:urease accessory protein
VGGYSFSQGLEYAIDSGWLKNAAQVEQWTKLQLSQSIGCLELPILRLSMQALTSNDVNQLFYCNDLVLASRESKELRLTDTAMGEALTRVMRNHGIPLPFNRDHEVSFVVLFAIAAHHWKINYDSSALGFSWSWLENQISAATKLVPLGQTQAQLILSNLQTQIIQAIEFSKSIEPDDIGACLPALAIASALHETQYSRLFRS